MTGVKWRAIELRLWSASASRRQSSVGWPLRAWINRSRFGITPLDLVAVCAGKETVTDTDRHALLWYCIIDVMLLNCDVVYIFYAMLYIFYGMFVYVITGALLCSAV